MTTLYTVTSGQRLLLAEPGRLGRGTTDDAAVLFRAYLAAPEQQDEEEYEQTQGEKLAPDERCDRGYRYVHKFNDEDVEETDRISSYTGKIGTTVEMTDSGGNG